MTSRFAALYSTRLVAVLLLISILCAVCFPTKSAAYSVLTHEAIVDAEWDGLIKIFLLERFPNATTEQLHEAHAYAYGGSVIQDMGYYFPGGRFFSHLTHYVRSGDYVEALFAESKDLNDYAFALGALSHYEADIHGHEIAVNRAVPLLYPRLHRKYGSRMTWEQNPEAHALTEFGYDVLEVVARHNAPQAYRDWIGFKVDKPLLERAFQKTYGLAMTKEIFSVDLALFSYRELAGKFIPEMTEVAWALRRNELEGLAAGMHHQKLYHLPSASYQAWRRKYSKPGPVDKLTAFIFKLIPKFGLLNAFDFHAPNLQVEQLFADSLKATVGGYESEIKLAQAGQFDPPDMDLDTGSATRPGEYLHCDLTYARLLHKLEEEHFAHIDSRLRDNLLSFYGSSAANAVAKHPREWRKVLRDLEELKATQILTNAQPKPAALTQINP
jgi:hypothetical protein